MKKFVLTSLTGLFFAGILNAQDRHETIEGNGKTVTRDITVSSFDELKASGVYELNFRRAIKKA